MKREDKASIIDELHGKFVEAKIAIVSDYCGLSVSALESLRRELKKNNAEIRVAKNTLLRRAVEDTDFGGMGDCFQGTTAVALSYDDPVMPAKVLADFAKDNPKFIIKSASLEGKILSADDVIALSKLPSKEVLLARLLSVMNGVPTAFVRVLNGVPLKLLYGLQAIRDQKNQADN
ncbi:MAG: 50S ribosomal protein L10 [Proteobacteria bacterium]|nr:50S ribosomal protein L10 [Pseudomonadota bacterium]MBU1687453.1 50S ribosomal protein L10 [Pseudomonadota bacterium]